MGSKVVTVGSLLPRRTCLTSFISPPTFRPPYFPFLPLSCPPVCSLITCLHPRPGSCSPYNVITCRQHPPRLSPSLSLRWSLLPAAPPRLPTAPPHQACYSSLPADFLPSFPSHCYKPDSLTPRSPRLARCILSAMN